MFCSSREQLSTGLCIKVIDRVCRLGAIFFWVVCLVAASRANEVSQIWEFGHLGASRWETKGKVTPNAAGPRPPEFPSMSEDNLATQFTGGGFLLQKDTGEGSFFDFDNGDEITIEAWLQLGKVREGDLMYLVGKGRSNQAGFKRDNQNWAFRVVSNGGLAKLSFLFATEPNSDQSHWHRWTSNKGFGAATGWHHIAICYRFGEPDSVKGWIDGLPTDGTWDMGGATTQRPVVDNDSIAIGSAVHGGKHNQLRGSLDYLAIHREILKSEVLSARFERKGGRIVWGPLPEGMPDLGPIQTGSVRVSVSEGWPASKRWLNHGEVMPKERSVWSGAEFLLPRLPARFDDWGIRQGWKTPVLLRMAADVELPDGDHEFLLRGRGLGRLWIDGELVARTNGKYRKTTNLESIEPVAEPPMPGGRPKSFSQEEVYGTKSFKTLVDGVASNVIVTTDDASDRVVSESIEGDESNEQNDSDFTRSGSGSTSRVVLEMVIGGAKLRTETTELTVAYRLEGEQGFQLLKPSDKETPSRTPSETQQRSPAAVALTDVAIDSVVERIERELVKLDNTNRRQAAQGQDGFWEARHQAARSVASKRSQVQLFKWQSQYGKAAPIPNGIDQWIQYRIDQTLFAAKQHDAVEADRFHSDVLPILREHCFRCHSEKAQGGLSLNQRSRALMSGDSGYQAVIPHDPENSELMARVIDGDMPPGEERLSEQQVATLRTWIAEGAAWPSPPAPSGLEQPVPMVGDARFLRRVFFDTIGLPPQEDVANAFLSSQEPNKREKLIDTLLSRDEDFASHWVSFWMDLLAENPTLLNASLNSTGPFRWFLHDAMRDNKALDRMVSELILMRGSTHDGGSAGFGLAGNNDAPMAEKAHILASSLLGIELQCARCHDSPFHSTTQKDLFSLAAMLQRMPATPPETSRVPDEFFEKQTRESLIRVTLPPGQAVNGEWPFGAETGVEDDESLNQYLLQPEDSRERLAALITSPHNQRFPRVIVNHLWNRLIGAGLVEPLHDWEGRSASHPYLLEWLALELVQNDFDLKHVLRLILNSELYQKQALGSNHGVAPEMRFFHAPDQRRLLAEQVVDSLYVATGRKMQAGELTFVHDGVHPMNRRLTLGSPKRSWEFASLNNERDRPSLSLPNAQPIADVLEAFGWTGSRQKPLARRDMSPNVLQPGVLSNGTLSVSLTRAASGSKLAELAIQAKSPKALIDRLFLRFLSRFPTAEEMMQLNAVLAPEFDERLVPYPDGQALPSAKKRFPQITWTNHLVPEANQIQLERQSHVLVGPPVDPRLKPTWRETYEDVIWSLVNHREFVWLP